MATKGYRGAFFFQLFPQEGIASFIRNASVNYFTPHGPLINPIALVFNGTADFF
jgi:hypothetical protein